MNAVAGTKTAGVAWTLIAPAVVATHEPDGSWHVDWKNAAAGLVIAVVFSYLPDLDHEGSTAGRALGKVGSRILRRIGGGHRGLTHSLFAIVGTWLVWAWIFDATTLADAFWNSGVQAAVAGLHPIALIHALAPLSVHPLAWAAGTGLASHIWCDALTVMGVPLLWPKQRKYRIASIRTGSPAEDHYTEIVQVLWGVLALAYGIIFLTSLGGFA